MGRDSVLWLHFLVITVQTLTPKLNKTQINSRTITQLQSVWNKINPETMKTPVSVLERWTAPLLIVSFDDPWSLLTLALGEVSDWDTRRKNRMKVKKYKITPQNVPRGSTCSWSCSPLLWYVLSMMVRGDLTVGGKMFFPEARHVAGSTRTAAGNISSRRYSSLRYCPEHPPVQKPPLFDIQFKMSAYSSFLSHSGIIHLYLLPVFLFQRLLWRTLAFSIVLLFNLIHPPHSTIPPPVYAPSYSLTTGVRRG